MENLPRENDKTEWLIELYRLLAMDSPTDRVAMYGRHLRERGFTPTEAARLMRECYLIE